MELNRRIRTGRQALDLTASELARRAGISPSYLSLIESGRKVPSEAVAARLARVLGEPEEDYRLWAVTSRMSGPVRDALTGGPHAPPGGGDGPVRRGQHRAAGGRRPGGGEMGEVFSDAAVSEEAEPPGNGTTVVSGVEGMEDVAAGDSDWPAAAPVAAAEAAPLPAVSSGVRFVPLLADGSVIPDDGPLEEGDIADRIPLPAGLAERAGADGVALRVTAASGRRVAATLAPGDIVLLDRRRADPRKGGIHAVRYHGAMILCRCVHRAGSLVIVSEDTARHAGEPVDLLPAGSDEQLRRLIAGRVILAIRIWR